ncbi:MAG: nucleoside hydrolase [Nocardioidaceae bacterium]
MTGPKTRVVIDTDPGIDDAAAILLALGSPELEVLGLTTVAGNAPLSATTPNALKILDLAGNGSVPVAAGADRAMVTSIIRERDDSVHGRDGLGGALAGTTSRRPLGVHAVDFLSQAADQAPISVVAIAPLTNIALTLARYPAMSDRIERLFIMGGARLEGNVTPAAEFNIWADPEAAARVFESGIAVTLVPLDVTHEAILSRPELDTMSASGPIGATLAHMLQFYERQHDSDYGEHFSPIHDALAVLALIDQDAMTYVEAHVAVECRGTLSRGATLVNTSRRRDIERNAKVATSLDRDRFARLLLQRVTDLDQRLKDDGRD